MVRRPLPRSPRRQSSPCWRAACGNVASDAARRRRGGEAPPGVTDDQIKIGATLPLTGTAAVSGQGLQAGIKMAVDEINAAGGIDGRKINLIILDDGFTADRVVTNVRRLVSQEKVYAVVAPAGLAGPARYLAVHRAEQDPGVGPDLPRRPEAERGLPALRHPGEPGPGRDRLLRQAGRQEARGHPAGQRPRRLDEAGAGLPDAQAPGRAARRRRDPRRRAAPRSARRSTTSSRPSRTRCCSRGQHVGRADPQAAAGAGLHRSRSSPTRAAPAPAARARSARRAPRPRASSPACRPTPSPPTTRTSSTGASWRRVHRRAGRERVLAADLQLRDGVRRARQAHGHRRLLRELHQVRRGPESRTRSSWARSRTSSAVHCPTATPASCRPASRVTPAASGPWSSRSWRRSDDPRQPCCRHSSAGWSRGAGSPCSGWPSWS